MSKIYSIKYNFPIDTINKEIETSSLRYWKSRSFKCKIANKRIFGKRGSIYGNLFSFDMTKLVCGLNIEFIDNNIFVEFLVNGKFQDITEVNLASFKIEQLLFPYYLKSIPRPEFLNEFLNFRNQAAVKWTFTFMTSGRKLSDELKAKIESLAIGSELPKVELK